MSLSERDSRAIWHPYTQMQVESPAVAMVRGVGALLFDEDGNEYIDAISSWWVNIHGHAHPYIAQRVSEQLRNLEHVMFAGFTHQPAVELAERLLKLLPSNQSKVFFSDDGSTAVEVGLKMAMQYWYNQSTKKRTFVVLEDSYHGDTFGAMSVSERDVFTVPFRDLLFNVVSIAAPVNSKEYDSLAELAHAVQGKDVAAFVFEPLLQGGGGMVVYEPAPLDRLIEFCHEKKILTIADEALTGFGRTGKMFASDYLKSKPDIICMSQGITGGTMALGVTSCTEEIYKAFLSDDRRKTFFHGHSYTGNPLACVAALANLDLLENKETLSDILRIEESHRKFADRLRKHVRVSNLRQIGTVLAFDVVTSEKTSYLNSLRNTMYNFFLSHGVMIRPMGNIIYIMPPYCISEKELDKIYDTVELMLDSLGDVALEGKT